ncbi:MAG: hypothetical protein ACREPM_16225 [Gemmatimonadaceae bacterium]
MRRSRVGLCLLALALSAACDVPTALPIYSTVWSVPVKSTTISVNSLLPANQVTATADNSAFQVMLSPSSASITRSLNQDCAACAIANGLSIPKPAFTGTGSANFAFPNTVANATLVRDTLTVTINNGFNFDPLRPSASARGYLILTVQSGGTVVGRDSIDGATTPLPASGMLVRKVPLSGAVSSGGGLQVGMTLNSPAGDPVVIDAARTITVSGSAGQVFVSSAQVNLANQTISAAPSAINLGGVDSSITNRAGGATLEMTVTNPFSVTGNLNITFSGRSQISKTMQLAGGTTSPTVTFSQSEIRSLLGQDVTMTIGGTVNGSNVTVMPGQTVTVSSRLVLTLNVGGN